MIKETRHWKLSTTLLFISRANYIRSGRTGCLISWGLLSCVHFSNVVTFFKWSSREQYLHLVCKEGYSGSSDIANGNKDLEGKSKLERSCPQSMRLGALRLSNSQACPSCVKVLGRRLTAPHIHDLVASFTKTNPNYMPMGVPLPTGSGRLILWLHPVPFLSCILLCKPANKPSSLRYVWGFGTFYLHFKLIKIGKNNISNIIIVHFFTHTRSLVMTAIF